MSEPLADVFSRVAVWTAQQCGRASTFVLACFSVLLWAVTGPFFGFSDAWQLVINTGTTIVTFLMIFLLQHAQNRDAAAIEAKLDALIRLNHALGDRLRALEPAGEAMLDRHGIASQKPARQMAPADDGGSAFHEPGSDLD